MIIAWSPFSGGPRVPSLVLAGMGVWLLWHRRAELWTQPALRRFLWIFALLWIPILISLPTSLTLSRSAGIAAVLIVYALAGVALVYILRDDRHREWLARWLAVVLAIWIIDGWVQLFFGRNLLGYPFNTPGRVEGVFHGSLRLSLFLAVLAPILFSQVSRRNVWLALIAFALSAVIVGVGGSRMAFFMLAIAVIGFSLRLPLRARIALLLSAVVVPIAIWAGSASVQERVRQTLQAEAMDFVSVDKALSGRLVIWETAVHMIADRPWTGVGAGAFAHAYDHYSTRPDDVFRSGGSYEGGVYHAHQMYLSIAAETGVLGGLAALAAFVLGMVWYYRAAATRRGYAWPFAFSLFIATFPLNSQPVIFTHWWFPVLLLLLCAMLAALDSEDKQRAQLAAAA